MTTHTVSHAVSELQALWTTDPLKTKPFFEQVYTWLKSQAGITMDFNARPGVSYSLRAAHSGQDKRPLFVLVDVVDDEPEARWLSVCFYADMITDPEELGDFVPEGLMGENACCLNLDADDEHMRAYILERIKEAAASAAQR